MKSIVRMRSSRKKAQKAQKEIRILHSPMRLLRFFAAIPFSLKISSFLRSLRLLISALNYRLTNAGRAGVVRICRATYSSKLSGSNG